MATVNKNFRVKNGLTVDGNVTITGTNGTINSSNILTEATVAYPSIPNVFGTISANGTSVVADSSTDTLTLTPGTGITITGDAGSDTITIANSDLGSAQNIFKTVSANGTSIVADSNSDTLTITPSTGITITGDAETDTVTITNSGVTQVAGTTNEITVSAGTGSVTIGLPDDVTIGNNLTVTGNLTVNGTTTTLNTDTLAVEDNIIMLNTNVTGTPVADAGLEVERGDYTNAKIFWKESENAWYLATPGDSGSAATEAVISTGGSTNLFNNLSDGTNVASPDSSNDTFTFTASTGISAVVNATSDTITITNTGVTSLAGTADQIAANASTGSVVLSLPQSINTTSAVQFSSVNVSANVTTPVVIFPNAEQETFTLGLTGTSATGIDTAWSSSTYGTAKYLIQARNAGGDIYAIEILAVATGSNVYVTEYAEVYSSAEPIITTDVTNAAGSVQLSVTGTNGVTVKTTRTLIEV
jgi:hypothetical protein